MAGVAALTWQETWTADWRDRWLAIGAGHTCSEAINNVLVMDCQSAAVQSEQRFPVGQRIEVSGRVLSAPGAGSTTVANLAHHVLLGADDGANGQYCGLYVSYDVAAGLDKVFHISYPYSAQIGSVPHGSHVLTVLWEPTVYMSGRQYGYCNYVVDGQLLHRRTYSFSLPDVAVWKGASSVNPGQGNDGSYSHAEHGPVTVLVGTASPTPTATPIPTASPTPTATPWWCERWPRWCR